MPKDFKPNVIDADEDNRYHFKLGDFDGPIDLLLDMVRRAKIRIEDIFISDITEQYLALMDQVDELDIEQAADFVVVAATLLEIKSRALLPRPETEEETREVEEAKTDLINRIEEYRIFKEAAERMREQEIINMHYRAPDNSVGEPRLVLKDMTTDGLVKALTKMFAKLGSRQQVFRTRKIDRDPFTVEQKINYIRDRVSKAAEVDFFDLFNEDSDRSEIVTTFSALLELLKAQEVTAEQKEIFSNIIIRRRTDSDGDRAD